MCRLECFTVLLARKEIAWFLSRLLNWTVTLRIPISSIKRTSALHSKLFAGDVWKVSACLSKCIWMYLGVSECISCVHTRIYSCTYLNCAVSAQVAPSTTLFLPLFFFIRDSETSGYSNNDNNNNNESNINQIYATNKMFIFCFCSSAFLSL